MVKSPIKIIDSGTAPTTANLGEGQIAFGTVDGATKLYESDGTTVTDLTASGGTTYALLPDYDNWREITDEVDDNGGWVATDDGFLVSDVTYNDDDHTQKNFGVYTYESGSSGALFPLYRTAVPATSADVSGNTHVAWIIVTRGKKFSLASKVNKKDYHTYFIPFKQSTITPNEFTDTGWMEITNSSGDGLPYLTGPFVIPSGSSLKIRKYGKRVNLIGTVQITEDLTYTNTEDFISIKQDQTVSSQAQFDDPPGTTTEVNEDYSRFMPLGNRYSELQFTDHGQIAECCYGFAAYNKISPTNGNSLRVKIAPVFSTSISNGTIININLSWDTED